MCESSKLDESLCSRKVTLKMVPPCTAVVGTNYGHPAELAEKDPGKLQETEREAIKTLVCLYYVFIMTDKSTERKGRQDCVR